MDGGGAAPHRRPMEPGVCHEVSDPPRSAIGPRVSSPHRCRALAPVACRAGLCSPPYPFHCCRSLLLYVYVASLHLFPSLSLSFSSTLFWYDSCSASFFNAPPTILFWGVFLGKKKGAAPRMDMDRWAYMWCHQPARASRLRPRGSSPLLGSFQGTKEWQQFSSFFSFLKKADSV